MKAALTLGVATFAMLLALGLPATAGAQTPTPPSSEPAAPAEEAQISVVVALENGTAGASAPPGIALTLYAVDGEKLAYTREATSDASGLGKFDDVPHINGRAYGVEAEIGGMLYPSALATLQAGQSELRLPLRIYDTTTSAAQLRVSQAYVLAEAKADGQLAIVNAYVLSNSGDRTIAAGIETESGAPATMRFPLPSLAQDVQFDGDDGSQFVKVEDGFLARPGVRPGDSTARMVARYTLPYSDSLRFELALAYPIDKVTVFVASSGISLTSTLLTGLATETREDGVRMSVWGAQKVAANQPVAFDLTGKPQPQPDSPTEGLSPAAAPGEVALVPAPVSTKVGYRELAGYGLVGVGVVTAALAAFWWVSRTRSNRNPVGMQQRDLVWALANLDEDRDAGRVEYEDYLRRRSRLKASLSSLQAGSATAPAEAPLLVNAADAGQDRANGDGND